MSETNEKKRSVLKEPWIRSLGLILAVLAICGGLVYLLVSGSEIKIDTSQVIAPSIELAPTTSGPLNEVYVKEGDQVLANQVVAKVGDELIKAKVDGTIISVNNDIGTIFNPGQPVVTMIDPNELRVVGTIDEDKGLSEIQVGQRASFTVDAFGSETFDGVVDEISPTSHQSGVVFNISDKRQIQQFDIKVRFEPDSRLKNGMSAKLTIYK